MYFSKDGWIVYHKNNIWWKKRLKSDWGLVNLNLKRFNISFKLSVYKRVYQFCTKHYKS